MEQINNHSPLPYSVDNYSILDCNGMYITTVQCVMWNQNLLDAEFIRTACNSYYQSQETISALTERVKELEELLFAFLRLETVIMPAEPVMPEHYGEAQAISNLLSHARALLTPKNNGE